jgi:hypothetical protein
MALCVCVYVCVCVYLGMAPMAKVALWYSGLTLKSGQGDTRVRISEIRAQVDIYPLFQEVRTTHMHTVLHTHTNSTNRQTRIQTRFTELGSFVRSSDPDYNENAVFGSVYSESVMQDHSQAA